MSAQGVLANWDGAVGTYRRTTAAMLVAFVIIAEVGLRLLPCHVRNCVIRSSKAGNGGCSDADDYPHSAGVGSEGTMSQEAVNEASKALDWRVHKYDATVDMAVGSPGVIEIIVKGKHRDLALISHRAARIEPQCAPDGNDRCERVVRPPAHARKDFDDPVPPRARYRESRC